MKLYKINSVLNTGFKSNLEVNKPLCKLIIIASENFSG